MDYGGAVLDIRRYHAADHDVVWNLHNLALTTAEAHAGNGPWDDDLHHIEEVYLAAGGDFLVGIAAGELVVMGALLRHDATLGEIKRMRVHPDVQRRGYGRQLLHALEAAALERGVRRLILDTTTVQTAAIALYEQDGYREERRTRRGGYTLLHFEKPLQSK